MKVKFQLDVYGKDILNACPAVANSMGLNLTTEQKFDELTLIVKENGSSIIIEKPYQSTKIRLSTLDYPELHKKYDGGYTNPDSKGEDLFLFSFEIDETQPIQKIKVNYGVYLEKLVQKFFSEVYLSAKKHK